MMESPHFVFAFLFLLAVASDFLAYPREAQSEAVR